MKIAGPCLALAALLGLAACGGEPSAEEQAERAAIVARAETLKPEDPELAGIYDYACHSCHANPNSGAPLTGDLKAWEPRLEKGMDVLLENTINGFEGMPPLGMCMDCSRDRFVALISFMAWTEE